MMNKQEVLASLNGATWNIQGFNAYPLYLGSAGILSALHQHPVFRNYRHLFFLFAKRRARMYYDEQDWRDIADEYYERYKNISALESLERRWKEELDAAAAKIDDDVQVLQRAQVEELIVQVHALCHLLGKAVSFAHAIEGITFGSEARLRRILEGKSAFTEHRFSVLCSPTYDSFMSRAQELLWRIQTVADNELLIAEYLEKFSWIENSYSGAYAFSQFDVKRRAKNARQLQPSHIAEEKNKLLKALAFTENERFVVETIETCFRWQDRRKEEILKVIERIDTVLPSLALSLDCEIEELRMCLPDEVTQETLMKREFREVLGLRKRGVAIYATTGHTLLFTGDEFSFFLEHLHEGFDDKIQELKGMSACKGIVTGIARICESISDIDRLQDGEILVASMTRPEYLVAMQRAAAFVTDEGGVTSHAAIVAREMHKPCVIGTKNATRVLRDGDRIEVDATNGVVRKLE